MKLKLVTIDFWNTLYDSSNGTNRNAARQRALINEIDKYDRLVKQEEFEKAMQALQESNIQCLIEKYNTSVPGMRLSTCPLAFAS
jgi:FMN phosphatase YigB (HAD superfamily)